jgi:hypothetical protein
MKEPTESDKFTVITRPSYKRLDSLKSEIRNAFLR